ncbi:MAG: thiosulfate oxidation carrier protein SoxY [Gammaproteobacteria bacterium]|nr:thiosulfate oxidation carrier protein SoxY [Gammaproteobacteria bacterium]
MNVDMKRRIFLKQSLAVGAMGMLVGTGMLTPKAALAAWPTEAFKNKDASAAMKALLGTDQFDSSADLKLTAPEIAENGAVVPLKVEAGMAGVETITLVAVNNPLPLVANFRMSESSIPYASTRIKMGESGDVIAIVKAGGKLYSTKQGVKVTVGGCG